MLETILDKNAITADSWIRKCYKKKQFTKAFYNIKKESSAVTGQSCVSFHELLVKSQINVRESQGDQWTHDATWF